VTPLARHIPADHSGAAGARAGGWHPIHDSGRGVPHRHKGGLGDDFEHRSYWHTHPHNHNELTHSYDCDQAEEQQHAAGAHVYDHASPTQSPTRQSGGRRGRPAGPGCGAIDRPAPAPDVRGLHRGPLVTA